MIIIKINQYKNKFENMYKKQQADSLEYVEQLINIYDLRAFDCSLNKTYFYFSKDVITIDNCENFLCGEVLGNKYKHLYMSYMTLDNRFNEYPEKSLLNFEEFNKYSFNIEVESDENMEVIPYIIHYREQQKYKLSKIENNKLIIDFKYDEKCRLTFKILGNGKFKIKRIRVTPKG